MKTAILIPARYGSTRFPGKPLALLKGKAVLHHVYDVACAAASEDASIAIAVATDDERIASYCRTHDIPCLVTASEFPTGTDRVMAAVRMLPAPVDFVVNLQGDAPLTPPDFVSSLIAASQAHPDADIVTPVVRLSWTDLDHLRESKETTPFSGTTAVLSPKGRALWFSKNIIPAIRKESDLRVTSPLSPVYRHIGLYGYKRTALERYITLTPSFYEEMEGLEQLRALENGMAIQAVLCDYQGRPAMTGIDSPEDLARAEALLS
ncbi:MAG: 3-deoxy-manno-octulosonate cytidylyltransferase [Pseudobdellovibrionaceae bacterium]